MSDDRISTAADRCFACGRAMDRPEFVFTEDKLSDGRHYEVHVGPECFKHVEAAGDDGYQPPAGGPRLFISAEAAAAQGATPMRAERMGVDVMARDLRRLRSLAERASRGPWKADTNSGCKRIKGNKGGGERQGQYDILADTVGANDETRDLANARLMAEAPNFIRDHADMLAAVAALVKAAKPAADRLLHLCQTRLRGAECAQARDDWRRLFAALACLESRVDTSGAKQA